ncbi:hypothetical protein EAF00_003863 [Botryotinia globosa]|nr:hypothetical protein EAF00_003863 [Botryotinia globosa]
MSLKVLLGDVMSFSTCHFTVHSALALVSNNLAIICDPFRFEASPLRVIDLGVVRPWIQRLQSPLLSSSNKEAQGGLQPGVLGRLGDVG